MWLMLFNGLLSKCCTFPSATCQPGSASATDDVNGPKEDTCSLSLCALLIYIQMHIHTYVTYIHLLKYNKNPIEKISSLVVYSAHS